MGGAQGLSIPDWITQRRNYILNELATTNTAIFTITSNGGNSFTSSQNYVTLTGTAPVEVKTIRVNGVAYPVLWTSFSTWSLQVPLPQTVNNLTVQGYDATDKLLSGMSDTITVTYTGVVEAPSDYLGLNEIMYNPAVPNAGFLEIHNRSSRTTFDLSGYRINGADFAFPEGTIIVPGGFAVVATDLPGFQTAYGLGIPVAGIMNGQLDNGGETLCRSDAR